MPYFFGIQLLQGSFLLLLIVERLQKEAGEGILNACEVMIRATESCVVTLNTEYQRNFRQVMRSAVAQARGRPTQARQLAAGHARRAARGGPEPAPIRRARPIVGEQRPA